MTTFHGKRTRRPGLMAMAVLVVVGAVAAIATLIVRDHTTAEKYIGWIAIPAGIGFFVLMILSIIPRKATLEVDGSLVRPSWRSELRVGPPTLGRYVMAVIDAPIGVYAQLGPIRVGAKDHDGTGFAIARAPSRSVDFELSLADFDALCAQLAVPRAPDDGTLAIELVRNGQSGGGILRTMAPWLATMALCSLVGVGADAVGIGMIPAAIACGVLIVLGLGTTIALSMRVKRPSLVLQVRPDGVVLARARGHDDLARAPWSAVRGAPRRLVIRGKGSPTILPALALSIGGHPIELAVWDPEQKWPSEAPKGSPPWIAGTPQWRRLVAALRAHRALEG